MGRLLLIATIILTGHLSNAQWTKLSGPTGGEVGAIVKVSNYFFANAGPGGIFRSSDSGLNWTPANSGLPDYPHCYVLTSSGNTLYAGIYQRGIYKSIDLGVTWVSTGGTNVSRSTISCLLANGNDLYAGNTNGGFASSTDGGVTWTVHTGSLQTSQIRAFVISNNRLFAAVSNTNLYYSDNKGATWTTVSANVSGINAITAVDNTIYISGGSNGHVSRDYGATWSDMTFPLAGGIYFTAGLYARGDALYAAASDGSVIYSTDEGAHWTQKTSSLLKNTHASIIEDSGALMVGTKAGVYYSPDLGNSWEERNNGLTNHIVTQIRSSGNIIAAATKSGIHFSADNGATWSRKMSGFGSTVPYNDNWVSGICFSGGNVFAGIWKSLSGGSGLFKSGNNGDVWTFVSQPGAGKIVTVIGGLGTKVVAGVADEGFYTSNDNGNSWFGPRGLFDNGSYKGLVIKGDTIVAAGSSNNVYVSKDYGTTWDTRSTPAAPLAISNLSKSVYIATINGVYRSLNLGVTWTLMGKIPGDLIPFDILMSPKAVMFISTDSGVYASSNEGATWLRLSGLDGVPISSLHLSATTLYAGAYGAGIYAFPAANIPIVVGILDDKKKSFTVYPNPVVNHHITLDFDRSEEMNIGIFDITGKKVKSELFSTNDSRSGIDLGDLTPGLYILKGESQSARHAVKIIVK